MVRSIKRYVLMVLLTASLLPLIAFGTIFFTQTYSFLVQKDIENIKYTLDREKKHIEDFIHVNINDMSLIALSADLKGQNQNEIMEIFMRFLSARKDFDKIKYIYPDGKIVEVTRNDGGRVYKKSPLSVNERFCLDNGEFAMYSGREDSAEFIIYSSPVVVNGMNMGVVTGYMPISNLNFLTVKESNLNIGRIYIKDSRDRFVTIIKDKTLEDKNDIELPIERTDWKLCAKLDKLKFAISALKVIFSNIVIFFVLVIVAIVPIAVYIAEYVEKPVYEFIYCTKSLTKLSGRSPAFYSIHEAIELKCNFNKMINLIENNKSEFEEIVYIDKLTGLYNQRFIEERLSDRIQLIDNNRVYLLMLEIDTVNADEIKLEKGIWDLALSEVGNIIKNNIRFMDIPTRYSQREFLVILTGVNRNKAMEMANRIASEIENHDLKAKEMKLNVQFGIAKYTGDMGKSIDESIQALKDKRKNS